MGGMQTWMWGERYPDMMDALLPIASLPERVDGRNLLWRRLLMQIVRLGDRERTAASSETPTSLGLAWTLFRLRVDSRAFEWRIRKSGRCGQPHPRHRRRGA